MPRDSRSFGWDMAGEAASDTAARNSKIVYDDDDDDDFVEEETTCGSMLANIYYALINLAITLGSVALILVSYWLFNWANVRSVGRP